MSDEGESVVTSGAATANADETEEVDFDINFEASEDEEEEEAEEGDDSDENVEGEEDNDENDDANAEEDDGCVANASKNSKTERDPQELVKRDLDATVEKREEEDEDEDDGDGDGDGEWNEKMIRDSAGVRWTNLLRYFCRMYIASCLSIGWSIVSSVSQSVAMFFHGLLRSLRTGLIVWVSDGWQRIHIMNFYNSLLMTSIWCVENSYTNPAFSYIGAPAAKKPRITNGDVWAVRKKCKLQRDMIRVILSLPGAPKDGHNMISRTQSALRRMVEHCRR